MGVARVSSKEECLHGTCVPQSWQGDGKPELNDAAAPAGTCLCLLIRRTVRGRLVMTEGGGAGPPRQYWSSLSAAPKCCSPAATPPSIRRSHARAGTVRCGPCGVLVRGLGRQPEIGLNKPANLSARGRGYPVGQCRYQAQTLGASRDHKIAAPRAAVSNSGSLLARRISAFRAPRRAPAPPPPPRRVGTHIPDMRAAPPPPPSPPNLRLGARRFYAVERSQLIRRRR